MNTIEIIVDPQGQVQLETKGYSGADCRTASQFLEQALGLAERETLKPEFHQTTTGQAKINQAS
jgi:Protein of unknown function (DUF2997)